MMLYYQQFGSGEPLIILHGLFGSGDNWRTVGKQLAENFTVYLVDLRNHGRSPHHPVHTYPAMAADVFALMDQLKLTSANLLGHSMGGKVAMYLALNHPHRVMRLVVVDIAPRRYPIVHLDILKAMQTMPLNKIQSRQDAAQWLFRVIHDPGIVQFLLKNLVREKDHWRWRVNLTAIETHIHQLSDWPDTGKRQFKGATLFVAGKKSTYINSSDYARIRQWFPAARFVTIPHAGHWVHADQPERFVKTVQFFLTHQFVK